ncbi:MAG: NAD-dependent epimerase/dehydratase family protein [Xanthobacteraceae bacterium]|nr:NAD-dependent epimerase/dehydratase family protein [Xanthobacteraceae bacterium]
MPTLVCLGLGYCARFYVTEFGSRFERVVGTSRTPDKKTNGPTALVAFDGIHPSPELRQAVAEATHLLISAAPGEAGDPVLAALAGDIAAAPKLQSIFYLSSLGVYGDHGGAWIDETAPTVSPHARGAARIEAERAWQALGGRRNTPVAILRLAGIYGPGQNAFVRLMAGRAHRITKPDHVFNRIHVADIAQAIDAAFARRFGGIVNVTDGEPAPPGDPIEFAAKLLGLAPPPVLSLDEARRTLSPFLLSFYDGCARVRNDKLRRELGVTLRYPDYRAGLQALFDEGFEARD